MAAGGLLSLAGSARADPPGPGSAQADVEPIALRYETSGPCSSQPEFVKKVRTHTQRWRLVPDGTPGVRRVQVHVSVGKSETVGRFTIASPDGGHAERKVVGPSCTELSEALAFMVAIAIDPRAGAAGASDGEPPAAAEDERGGEVPATRTPAGAPPSAPPGPSAPSGPPGTGPRPGLAPDRDPTEDGGLPTPRVWIDVRAETTSAVVRGGLPGIGASVGFELPGSPRPGVHLAGPGLAIGVRQSLPQERRFRGGSASVAWTAGQLRLCPVRVLVGELVEVSPCAEANVGSLRVSGRGFSEARTVASAWFDVGGSLSTSVSLSDRIFLSSTLLVTVPLVRQPFALRSGVNVASVPPRGVLGGLGLGVRW